MCQRSNPCKLTKKPLSRISAISCFCIYIHLMPPPAEHASAKQTVRCRLPMVGSIRVDLHNDAGDLFRWLRRHGEIARLRRLPQLGIVQEQEPSAHHTRWEYVALISYLTDRAKLLGITRGVHLSSNLHLP